MEAAPSVVSLDALVAKLREHEAAPKGLKLAFPIAPDLSLLMEAASPDPDLIRLVLACRAPSGAANPDDRFAFEAAVTVAGRRRSVALAHSGVLGEATPAAGKRWHMVVVHRGRWSQLRNTVAEEGASLEAALVTLPRAPPVGPSDACALRVAGGGAGTFAAAGGALLDGPFTDVAVAAGGQTFRAHRVVLAAASPVFLCMLDGGMREAREAAVELRDADPAVVELLLRHIYGGAIEVPLAQALPLYALADQYQLSSGLQRQLRLWLASLQLAPDALCGLFPAALYVCPQVATGSWSKQAVASLPALSALPAFGSWPVDAVVEVLKAPAGPIPHAVSAAVRWMAGQEKPAKQRHRWPRLLDCMPWRFATASELRAVRCHSKASVVPGLSELLFDAWERLGTRLPAGATAFVKP